MPLATPTGLSVSRLYAQGSGGYFLPNPEPHIGGGGTLPGPTKFGIYGVISWENTETQPHTVELMVGAWKTYLPKGSSSALVPIGQTSNGTENYINPLGSATLTVTVQLRGEAGDSSVLSGSAVVNMTAAADFSGSLSFGTALIIPTWSNVAWNPTFQIFDEAGKMVAGGNGTIGGSKEITGNEYGKFQLTAGKTYRAEMSFGYGFNRKSTIIETRISYYPYFLAKTYYYYTKTSDRKQTLFFSPDEAEPFAAVSEALKVLRGSRVTIPLKASHRATWAINSGAPAGFVITARSGVAGTDYYLEGTATTSDNYEISLTATRTSDSATANATIVLSVVATENPADRIQIITNPGWLNNGLAYTVGDVVSVALASTPSNDGAVRVIFTATGLPPGLAIDRNGMISGKAATAGRFITTIVAAPAPGNLLQASLPATITFTVRDAVAPPGGGGGGTTTVSPAVDRIPWILSEWTLTDLQILARAREVQSTLADKTGIRLKIGDNVNFAVFFVGADNLPFDLEPEKLRITIRPADNIGDPLVFESDASPSAITTSPDPYFLVDSSTGARERETVQDWVEASGKNESLACVADVEWTKDSQVFSSQTFAVLMELDVARP